MLPSKSAARYTMIFLVLIFPSYIHATDDGYVHDVAFLSKTHFVLAKWFGGVAVTRDGGLSWKEAKTIPINKLTIGSNGQIWGFHSWSSFETPSQATLTYSTDGGSSWTSFDLDAKRVLPTAFINQPGTNPVFVTENGQLWILTGPPQKKWAAWAKSGVPNPDGNAASGLDIGESLYVASESRIWMTKNRASIWSSADIGNIAFFANDGNTVWAINHEGVLFRTPCGENKW
jgi:hypothetical protein